MDKRITKNVKKLQSLAVAAAATLLTACAGGTPAPCTDVPVQNIPQDNPTETTAVTSNPTEQPAVQQPAVQNVPEAKQAAEPEVKTAKPEAQPAAKTSEVSQETKSPSTSKEPETVQPAELEKKTVAPDPYQDFPALAHQIFAHADTLYKQGLVDSAVTYLQRFRIIKPLWNQWEQTADSLLQEFGKTNAELAKQFEPLVMQIINMNRVQTAYSMVAETADSLISLAPGDSLTQFAKEQKQIAYNNTLKRAQKEMASIKALAEQQAKFAEAEQRATDFQMRHRDFEEQLKIQALIDYIKGLAQATDSEDAKYWEKNDPAEAMKKADELMAAKKYAQAKELLNKLKASTLRKEAMEKYVQLADAFCNAQRKETSQLFAKAQKQKDTAKKKDLMKAAIEPLDKCLGEYPESTLIKKVQDNKNFLEKEMAK
ncbi:hypothetical protein [Fibrobacter sp. UWEL]|uniref:hypothetical protein n=1 Tax=Fibrobacter sp. UWEL TaxID=1896209 RepID=UPI0009220356|nr:hypothetical protein [Fibrobacter sp. UWEL]SHK85050.1 hypothetical protein SAMN05720468_10821 [Fibrobacter sp. UWEL]